MKGTKNLLRTVGVALMLVVGLSFLYNLYALFFPISTQLEADAAEHLHAVYLLGIGKRPYLDFIQNHPMLFHHFLLWVETHFHIESVRNLALVARVVIFGHMLICLAVFGLWTSRVIKHRPKALLWTAMLAAAWAMLDIYNTDFHFIWDLRPDFVCYGQTLLGLYLIYRWIARPAETKNRCTFILAVAGGCLIGFGNAILPKGVPFVGAFALTLFTYGALSGRATVIPWLTRRMVYGSMVIGAAMLLSFFSGMLLDCHLSHVPVRSWIAAVFLLNSKKHIIFANTEVSPVTHILNFFSVPLPLAIALIMWAVWELCRLSKNDRRESGAATLWLFSVFTILVNMILPTYSTGVTWSYYYVPSMFAAATICLLLLLRLWDYYEATLFDGPLSIQRAGVIILGFFLVIQLLNNPVQSISAVTARQAFSREVSQTNLPDYVNNVILPSNFVYLGYPNQIPIKSETWGYYSMLTRATDFWRDCHALGLGPDPQKEWGEGFGNNPPDAIAFTSPDEISELIFQIKVCHKLDISWLWDEIRDRYVLMTYPRASLYVLRANVPMLESQGWRPISK